MESIFAAPKHLVVEEGTGFIKPNTLINFLDKLCSEIKYPITLIYADNNNNLRRMDSARVGFLLDNACDTFRKFGGYDCCIGNDNTHARPFLLEQKAIPSCGYEMYRCKYMGYQEYIFPIQIEKQIVAVIFVGQIQISNDKTIEDYKKRCIKLFEKTFKDSLSSCSSNYDIHYEDIARRILSNKKDPFIAIPLNNQNDVNKNQNLFIDDNDVLDFIQKTVIPQIRTFEEMLIEVLFNYRKSQISQILADFEDKYNNQHINFLKQYDQIAEKTEVNIEDYWLTLQRLFKELCNLLNLKKIVYYEQKKEGYKKNSNKYEIKISTEISELGEETVLTEKQLQSTEYIVDERANLNYVLKIEFHEQSLYSKPLSEFLLLELSIAMKATLDICSSAIYSKMESNNNLTTLRIYRHEMDQLIFTLGSINFKLSSQYKEELDSLKIEKMHKDFESSLQSAYYMSKNLEYFTQLQRGIPFNHDPIVAINIFNKLNKWRLFVMDNVIMKNSNIIVPTEEERRKRGDAGYSSFLCVEQALECILYNIINNAIKYCHRGTNIYLDCQLKIIDGKERQVISIIDYGKGIHAKHHDDIFKLYYRDIDAHSHIDGSGIGLYVSKIIADDIGVTLDYHCEFISDYNVPLIERYIDEFYYPPTSFLTTLKNEYNIIQPEIFDSIISQFSKKISRRGIKNDINIPTYKVTFEVIV